MEGGGNERGMSNYSRFLPIANISRIMKKALPDNAKIAKDAKETLQECVSEFISFITSEACEKCKNEKRKTINGEDLLFAINTLGFESYTDILKLYLHRYREALKATEKNPNAPSAPDAKKNQTKKEDDDEDDDEDEEEDEEDRDQDQQQQQQQQQYQQENQQQQQQQQQQVQQEQDIKQEQNQQEIKQELQQTQNNEQNQQ